FNAPADRYFYLPSVGYALFVAGLLVRLPYWLAWLGAKLRKEEINKKHFMFFVYFSSLIGAALLLTQVNGLLAREMTWARVGQSGATIVAALRAAPPPPTYATIYLVDAPATQDGLPLLGEAVAAPLVQLVYADPTLNGVALPCTDLATLSQPGRRVFFQY